MGDSADPDAARRGPRVLDLKPGWNASRLPSAVERRWGLHVSDFRSFVGAAIPSVAPVAYNRETRATIEQALHRPWPADNRRSRPHV